MTFKGRLITEMTDNTDGTNNYATNTSSIIVFKSTVATVDLNTIIELVLVA